MWLSAGNTSMISSSGRAIASAANATAAAVFLPIGSPIRFAAGTSGSWSAKSGR